MPSLSVSHLVNTVLTLVSSPLHWSPVQLEMNCPTFSGVILPSVEYILNQSMKIFLALGFMSPLSRSRSAFYMGGVSLLYMERFSPFLRRISARDFPFSFGLSSMFPLSIISLISSQVVFNCLPIN